MVEDMTLKCLEDYIMTDYNNKIDTGILNAMMKEVSHSMGVPSSYVSGVSGCYGAYSNGTYSNYSNSIRPMRIEHEYPLTFDGYSAFVFIGDLPESIEALAKNNASIYEFFSGLQGTSGEKFVARLIDVRATSASNLCTARDGNVYELEIGHVYDPWLRDITTIGEKHYKPRLGVNPKKFVIKVSHDHDEVLLIWEFMTTIHSNPINLYLYEFAKFYHVNKPRVERHMTKIHPFSKHDSKEYDSVSSDMAELAAKPNATF